MANLTASVDVPTIEQLFKVLTKMHEEVELIFHEFQFPISKAQQRFYVIIMQISDFVVKNPEIISFVKRNEAILPYPFIPYFDDNLLFALKAPFRYLPYEKNEYGHPIIPPISIEDVGLVYTTFQKILDALQKNLDYISGMLQ